MSLPKRIVRLVALLLALPVAALWWVVAQPVFGRHAPSEATADAVALQRDVAALSEAFHPRSFYDTNNLARCADYIESRFREAGLSVTSQLYTAIRTPCRNVVAVLPGRESRRVVVGAHYDAAEGTPGADDNASGVAGLLELARLLRGARPRHTIELVAFCTEEPPCFGTEHMGSAQHARKLSLDGTPVEAMIALEMIGFYSDERDSQCYPVPMLRLFYPSAGRFVAVVGDWGQRRLAREVKRAMKGSTPLPVYSLTAPAGVPGVDLSDHRCYWEQGYPAVMVTDTAFFRNVQYHRPGDTADRLDYGRMGLAVVAVCEAVRALAECQ